jgi:hypothetical protein
LKKLALRSNLSNWFDRAAMLPGLLRRQTRY